MDNERQAVQITLLAQPAKRHFADRDDVYVGANMFVYFSPDQVMTYDFRGPDVFVVTGTTKRERKRWVTWQEGKAPDLVIEILSDSTHRTDRTLKKQFYATRLRAPEYFWYDPFSGERVGFILHGSEYLPLDPDRHDRLPSRQIGLTLVRWHGVIEDIEATWLRWATPDGMLIPTAHEAEAHGRAFLPSTSHSPVARSQPDLITSAKMATGRTLAMSLSQPTRSQPPATAAHS